MRPATTLLSALLVLAPLGLASSAGCGFFFEPKADVDNPSHFSMDGLAFDYPGNWKFESEREDLGDGVGVLTIYVEAKSGNAMVMIQRFSEAMAFDYDEAVSDFVGGVKDAAPGPTSIEELDGGQRPVIRRSIAGAEREGRKVRYAVEVFGESVPHTVEIFFIEAEAETLVVYTQISDEDRSKATPGFDLVLDSLSLGAS